MDQLIERGASIDKRNDMGHLPNDVAQKRPTNSRFRQLRAMAESTPDDPNKNKRQSTQQRRQQDIALLSKRSAVKNNPLFKKFEQQQQQQSDPPSIKKTSSPLARNAFLRSTGDNNGGSSNDSSNSGNNNNNNNTKLLAIPRGVVGDDDNGEPNSEDYPRRTSKIISSLKNKSYVSSSVFRQTQPEQSSSPSPSSPSPSSHIAKSSPLKEQSIMEEEEEEEQQQESDDNENHDQGKEQTQIQEPSSESNDDDLKTPEIKAVPSLLVEQVAPEPSREEKVHEETKELVQEVEDMQQKDVPFLQKENNEDQVPKTVVEIPSQEETEKVYIESCIKHGNRLILLSIGR